MKDYDSNNNKREGEAGIRPWQLTLLLSAKTTKR